MKKIAVLIPCSEEHLELAKRTAYLHKIRAGMDCDVHIALDVNKVGWVKMINGMAKEIEADYYVYSCADYVPGKSYLANAFQALGDKGLVAFNDGKWFGQLATVGLISKEYMKTRWDGNIFYEGYKHHFADFEIVVKATKDNMFVYNPNAVLFEVDFDKEKKSVYEEDRLLFNYRMKEVYGNEMG